MHRRRHRPTSPPRPTAASSPSTLTSRRITNAWCSAATPTRCAGASTTWTSVPAGACSGSPFPAATASSSRVSTGAHLTACGWNFAAPVSTTMPGIKPAAKPPNPMPPFPIRPPYEAHSAQAIQGTPGATLGRGSIFRIEVPASADDGGREHHSMTGSPRPPGRNRQPLQIRLRHPGQTDWPDLWENCIAIFAGWRPSAHPDAMPIGKGRKSVLQHIDQGYGTDHEP